MSLDYKILCVDDNPKLVKSKLKHIDQFLEEEGFRPTIKLIEDGKLIDKYLNDPLLDLIVTDYNIHDDLNGKQLAEKVRQSGAIVDIILYSQQKRTDLYDEVGTLDGVYISNRDGLEDKIKDVIRTTIRRTQNINNMRGIVISEAIDIENQVKEIILSYFRKEKDLAERVLEYELCDFGKKIFFLNAIMKKILKYLSRKSSDTKLDLSIRKGWEAKRSEVHAFRAVCKRLADEVMKPRNILAHVAHEVDEDNRQYLQSMTKDCEEIRIDSDWCKDKRKHLAEHVENLERLLSFINSNTFDWDN